MKKLTQFIQLFLILLTLQTILTEHNHREILQKYINGPTKQLFKVYHSLFEKEYSLNSKEGFDKYKVFKDNLKFIKEYNSKNTESFMAIGPFADLTREEYVKKYLTDPEIMEKNIETATQEMYDYNEKFLFKDENGEDVEYIPSEELELENENENETESETNYLREYQKKDWREYDSEVRGQGGICGCCWAFSTTAAVENAIAYKNKCSNKNNCVQPHYSTQILVNCAHNPRSDIMFGCNGGTFSGAYDYLKEYGLLLDEQLPYNGQPNTCPDKSTLNFDTKEKVYGYQLCTYTENICSKRDNWNKVLENGAAYVVVDANSEKFQHYGGGVVDLDDCDRSTHSVLAVSNTNNQIVFKNSWGKRWGENGYMTVKRNPEKRLTCNLESNAWRPIVTKPKPTPPKPKPTPKPGPTPNSRSALFCKNTSYKNCYQMPKKGSVPSLSKINMANVIVGASSGKFNSVYIFEQEYCKGKYINISSAVDDFRKNSIYKSFYKKSNSVAVLGDSVRDRCVKLYKSACFHIELEFCWDMPQFYSSCNDRFKSVRFGKYVSSIELYTQPNYGGKKYTIKSTNGNFDYGKFKGIYKKSKSLKINSS